MSVSLLQLWSWGWRMDPTAVRGEWKWSTKENGEQWMIWIGAWRRCGSAVDAPTRAKFGPGNGPIWFHYIHCKGPESAITECSYSTVEDHHPKGHSHDNDAGASCSGKCCLAVWSRMESQVGEASVSPLNKTTKIWITAFRTFLGEHSSEPVMHWMLDAHGSQRSCLSLDLSLHTHWSLNPSGLCYKS